MTYILAIVRSNHLYSWDEGLLDMCIGEKRTLTVPPEYGYGQRSVGPIPAGSTLSEYTLPALLPSMRMQCCVCIIVV